MQSEKAPKKTRKRTEKTITETPEKAAAAPLAAKPRTTRSSEAKKAEFGEAGSLKHHHKNKPSANVETGVQTEKPAPNANASLGDRPARMVTHHQIAELAHSYWAARGYEHGSAELDWLRAEEELTKSL